MKEMMGLLIENGFEQEYLTQQIVPSISGSIDNEEVQLHQSITNIITNFRGNHEKFRLSRT